MTGIFFFLSWHSFSKSSWKLKCAAITPQYHTSLSLLAITPVLNSSLSQTAGPSLCDLWTHVPDNYTLTNTHTWIRTPSTSPPLACPVRAEYDQPGCKEVASVSTQSVGEKTFIAADVWTPPSSSSSFFSPAPNLPTPIATRPDGKSSCNQWGHRWLCSR